MLNPKVALEVTNELSILRFFPSGGQARAAISELLMQFCSTDAQARWLVRRVWALYSEWPGPRELRAVFCSKFPPADGIEADSTDARFLETGIPSERPLLESESPKQLISVDPKMRALVVTTANRKRLK
jgi:hypothetical protein